MIIKAIEKDIKENYYLGPLNQCMLVSLELYKSLLDKKIYQLLKEELVVAIKAVTIQGHFITQNDYETPKCNFNDDEIYDFLVDYLSLKIYTMDGKEFSDCLDSVPIALSMIEDEIPLEKIRKYTDLNTKELEFINEFVF